LIKSGGGDTLNASIRAISYYLPEQILNNDQLAAIYDNWTAEKIFEKTGIKTRHIASEDEYASDLAEKAALLLFEENDINPEDIDFIMLATQSPDYILPTTACILQNRLGIPKSAGAIDYNLGCSAFIYGLALSKGLISTNICKNVLLIMAETYSKHIHPMDKSTRTIFGDGAAAILVSMNEIDGINEFILGTDGSGAGNLIIPAGGMKLKNSNDTIIDVEDENGSIRSSQNLYMNGPEVFNFTIDVVPKTVNDVLIKNHLSMDDIDLFIFHQANQFMLNYLRKKIKIPEEKFYVNIEQTGNTVSASIPIALRMAEKEGRIKKGDKVLLVGFGVGLSWGATIIRW
jgi:3-oxoacyl-[acyl-carrier-protein] synthase-3